ncbi:hypothetical protein [Caldiplasma sukawensis]
MSQIVIFLSIFLLISIISLWKKNVGYILIFIFSIFFPIFTYSNSIYWYFILISSTVWAITSLYSIRYGKNFGRFVPAMLGLLLSGMTMILLSSTYAELIIGWELMSLPAYGIIGVERKKNHPAFVFIFFSEISLILIILGSISSVTYVSNFFTQPILPQTESIGFLLIIIGSTVKMGISPFMLGEWFPISRGDIPSNFAAIMSSTMTLMGVFTIFRFIIISQGNPYYPYAGFLLIFMGTLTVIFASMYSYISENFKALASFSTIENQSILAIFLGLMGISLNNYIFYFAEYGVIIFSFAHSIAKMGVFLSIGSTGGQEFSHNGNGGSGVKTAGTILSAVSLSGLFPTLGGIGTWMFLESMFMNAYLSLQNSTGIATFSGIVCIISGSIVAMSEGMISGAMIKLISFLGIFSKNTREKPNFEHYIIMATGILLILLFISVQFILPPVFIGGLPSTLVLTGFSIESKFSSADFGLISPVYILTIISFFFIMAILFMKRPLKTRRVSQWNTGTVLTDRYTSYNYSTNIRLMLKKILRTNEQTDGNYVTIMDYLVKFSEYTGILYTRISRKINRTIMNSSISWYIIYMIIAFLTVLIITILLYVK